jgi:hypothetical protein
VHGTQKTGCCLPPFLRSSSMIFRSSSTPKGSHARGRDITYVPGWNSLINEVDAGMVVGICCQLIQFSRKRETTQDAGGVLIIFWGYRKTSGLTTHSKRIFWQKFC